MDGKHEVAFGIGETKEKALHDMVRRYPGTASLILSLSGK